MENQSGSDSYNMFLKLVKDIEEFIAKTNKEQVKQIKPKLPSFMTESSGSPEVKEDGVSVKAKEEKKKHDDMEMLLDKKKRLNFLKVQTKQATSMDKIELKQNQQKLGESYVR